MLQSFELKSQILSGKFDNTFKLLYPQKISESCRDRYILAIDEFEITYGESPVVLVCAPGRTEVAGNHTDHQNGRVIAAAVDLDVVCVASPTDNNTVNILSAGYSPIEINLDNLEANESEKGSTASLVKGIFAWFKSNNHQIGGFNAYITSDVLSGSGLSSSAAFEVAIGNIIKALYAPETTPLEIALAGRFSENHFFGKPCGLMDQLSSSVGGFVSIDFEDPLNPIIEPVNCDFESSGYIVCIVDTGGNHANLTNDYAVIFKQMGEIATYFGKTKLREVDEAYFYEELPVLRKKFGDRVVLRAIHFFNDNAIVPKIADDLKNNNLPDFLDKIIASGRSSFTCLQNIYSTSDVEHQGISLALALSEEILAMKGAWRVHGGGFAGTIQAFLPKGMANEYSSKLNHVFGHNACRLVSIRKLGGIEVLPHLV